MVNVNVMVMITTAEPVTAVNNNNNNNNNNGEAAAGGGEGGEGNNNTNNNTGRKFQESLERFLNKLRDFLIFLLISNNLYQNVLSFLFFLSLCSIIFCHLNYTIINK